MKLGGRVDRRGIRGQSRPRCADPAAPSIWHPWAAKHSLDEVALLVSVFVEGMDALACRVVRDDRDRTPVDQKCSALVLTESRRPNQGRRSTLRTAGDTRRPVGMHPYTLAIERFPSSRSGEVHHHETRKIEAADDAAAIQQAKSVANELFSAHGAKVVIMVIGPTSGRPIETIERG